MGKSDQPWYLRTARRWQAFRDVPWRRLWLFAAAAFFLFSVIGLINDLMAEGQTPYAIVIVLSVVSGINAVLWIIVVARFPVWVIFPLIAFQFVMGSLLERLATWMSQTFALAPVPPATGVRFAGGCILLVIVVSYVLFVTYFRVQGRETMRIRNELELAHGIQKTLVPPVMLRTERFEVYGISRPSEKVGGDLVDVLQLTNGDIVAYVADIAGHGLSAGILMGMLKTAVHTALLDAASGYAGDTLPLLLEKLNRVLPQVKEPQMYATVTAFRLNADGTAWYAMAASPPALHWSDGERGPRVIEDNQFPLGLLPVSGFSGQPINLCPGDLVVVATDGVLEVCNRHEEEFGIGGLQETIESGARLPAEQIADSVLARVRAFGPQADDQTLLVIRRSG